MTDPDIYVGIGNDDVETTHGANLVLHLKELEVWAGDAKVTLGDVRIHLNELADNGQLSEKLAMYHRAKAEREIPRIPDAETLQALLACVNVVVPVPDIETWTDEQKELADDWAARLHLLASDNDIEVPPKPDFLNDWPEVKP